MSPITSNELGEYLKHTVVVPRVAPHAAAAFAQREKSGWKLVMGATEPTVERFFDLASITKAFTAVTVSSIVQKQKLSWDQTLEDLLPVTQGTWGGRQSLAAHLSHRAGMVPHREFFKNSWQGVPLHLKKQLRHIAQQRGSHPPSAARYSDLGYILVGNALENLKKKSLDQLVSEEVALPWRLRLGSARALLKLACKETVLIAPTEIQPRRGGPLKGIVHDDNAWMLNGFAASGHAGLFGTVEAVARFGMRLLDLYDAPLMLPLVQARGGGSLLMGFDGKSAEGSTAGNRCGPRTFGHLGFTGTSLWCDPDRQRVTVLLTNRVFPTRDNPKLQPLRSKIHDFLWGS